MTHTGCILCDTWLRGTIYQFFSIQKNKLLTAAEQEQANKLKEERKRQKEEKKKLNEGKEAEDKGKADAGKDQAKKKKKKQGGANPDLLTSEERIKLFMMQKFDKKQ